MNSLDNITYSKKIVSSLVFGATLLLPNVQADTTPIEKISYKPSYDQYVSYGSTKQSTTDDSVIQNDIQMLKLLEIAELNSKINAMYNTEIIKHWIPADGMLDKTCLFVKVANQESFMSEKDFDFELDLYVKLQDEIKQSNFFDMIALI